MGGNNIPASETPSIASLLMAQDPAHLQVLMTTLALANTESQALLTEVLTGSGPLGTVTQGDPMGAADAFGAGARVHAQRQLIEAAAALSD